MLSLSESDKITLDVIVEACEKMQKRNELIELSIERIRKMCNCLEDSMNHKKKYGSE